MWQAAWFSWTGADNPAGVAYGFWSGFGSVVLPGIPPTGVLYWKHRCHEPWCWKIGRYTVHEIVDGGEHVWQKCRKHHPQNTQPGPVPVGTREART